MPLTLTTAARMRLAEQTRLLLDEHGCAHVSYEPGDATHYEWVIVAPKLTSANALGQSYAGEVRHFSRDCYIVTDVIDGCAMLVPDEVVAAGEVLHYSYVDGKMRRGEHYAVMLAEFVGMVAGADTATLDRMRGDFPHIFGDLAAQ